ncbi:hypothetical protein MXD81_52045 [Microbacteriaceae bacterium K1510]|nr:hypothetical protein [Microbacteriaceae bacterium K1510]
MRSRKLSHAYDVGDAAELKDWLAIRREALRTLATRHARVSLLVYCGDDRLNIVDARRTNVRTADNRLRGVTLSWRAGGEPFLLPLAINQLGNGGPHLRALVVSLGVEGRSSFSGASHGAATMARAELTGEHFNGIVLGRNPHV